ncbi:unnamed protein product [Microthlaspi erraticum]|uniref:Uncharacterized protein n=1 Tax=Microthlaspi erraticum TaxID=1685480 RepID=A0A6D2K2U4_9BRAS|nr:unnamed protein product [Microthlaspi erraticum]
MEGNRIKQRCKSMNIKKETVDLFEILLRVVDGSHKVLRGWWRSLLLRLGSRQIGSRGLPLPMGMRRISRLNGLPVESTNLHPDPLMAVSLHQAPSVKQVMSSGFIALRLFLSYYLLHVSNEKDVLLYAFT